MNEEEIIYSIALTQVPGIGVVWGRNLLEATGSATDIFRNRKELLHSIPGITPRIVDLLNNPEAIKKAEKEYAFIQKNRICCYPIHHNNYPARLRECNDAPVVLFYTGNANLNSQRIISMIGTRNATEYGKELCTHFLKELHDSYPELLIISGLAYGIDIHAHRAALNCGLSTVGVLAHGLDRIYPPAHRKTAVEMLHQGGLLTEFISGTNPDKHNFVSRNRIVAGISDATIVVESATKGGSLITAEIANDYHRDCFAFPGRATDHFSQGCNQLIQDSKASLIQSASDFIQLMGWDTKNKKPTRQQQLELFAELSEEESIIVDILRKEESLQINALVVQSNIPIHKIHSILFELEMKGAIRALAGGMYRLS